MDNATCVEYNDTQYPTRLQLEEYAVTNFGNQVGGRAKFVSINLGEDKSIGKPLNTREYNFYETTAKTLPNNLLGFIPNYKGVVEIKNGKPRALEDKLKKKDKGCYIVLEDVTSTFSKPSIMDLKMGTRQHSDSMPPEKIQRKKNRSLLTTSNDLGLRIAGIRSFNENEHCGHYHMDKMRGRELTTDTLLDAFRVFFYNGEVTQYLCISVFLKKLYKIIGLIEKLNIRLYCCSLLLVYESDIMRGLVTDPTDIRIIDFAHAEFEPWTVAGEKHNGPDKGFLQGLHSLAGILQKLELEGEAIRAIRNNPNIEEEEEEEEEEDEAEEEN